MLGCALNTFWANGYDGTSLDQLMRDTGLSRQSLYNAFGDKDALFLACLERYQTQSVARLEQALEGNVRRGFEAIFKAVLDESDVEKRRGCIMVNSAMELAPRHVKVADVVARNQRLIEDTFAAALARAATRGELPFPASRARATARFLVGALHGLRVLAKTDPHSDALRDVVSMSLRVLEG